ncbi:major facilitator superfamily domain-containing protein [Ilyonectria robusta]|uniref:major facilitator superfamily domain-containing protein n=1 Tax=Ilyonectria robusta TaxID=1079257 RepID=UPI001E8CBAAE|nr:major facilitator superfamily domain-containing protein [Ilyonectria robusta]KAH8667743.1 major facilitator superfamily domain-containing protein [Ilyonectria robusta]
MAIKEPLASSADSQMTGMTLQTAGREAENDFTDKSSVTEQPDAEAAPPAGYKSDAPNGGTTAWLVVLGAWCTSFCSFGWINSVGVFQEYYQNNMLKDYSASTISWIPSLQIFFMMGMGPIIGMVYDRYGPRHLILAGTFLHVFGIMMTSLGKEYYQIMLAQGVCSALGVSAIFQPALNTIHGWFSTNSGAAFGILATGSSIGGVIFPIMVTRLIEQVGFGWAMRICGFLILGLLIIANLTVRAFHPPRPQKITPEQLMKPFHEPEFVLLIIGFFLFTYGIYVPINYLPVQALAAGMDTNLIEYLIPILNAASLFGRIFSGIMGDRVGRYNIFILVGYLTALWTLALWIPVNKTAGIIAFAALFGFCSGAYVSLIAPLVAQISPMQEIGFRTGIVFFISSVGGLTTNPINGAIIAGPSGLTGIKIFAGVFCFAGTVFIMAARVHRMGWSLTAKF